MKKYSFLNRALTVVMLFLSTAALFTSCKEDIDESNLYTFTGETIEDYLANREDQFGSFNYILKRIGYDKILSAYGMYTCFAPNNEAVAAYLDSLYNDPVNTENPHNGLTAPGLEGLTDSGRGNGRVSRLPTIKHGQSSRHKNTEHRRWSR